MHRYPREHGGCQIQGDAGQEQRRRYPFDHSLYRPADQHAAAVLAAAGLDPDDLPRRGAIGIAADIDVGAREKRPERWRDIWSAEHSMSGVTGVLSVDDLVARTIAEYRAADARSPVSPV
jgi:hypothetical protein